MKNIILITFLFSLTFIEAQQEKKVLYPEPYPSWRIITSKIKYPDLAMLSGVNNSYKVCLTVDYSGNQTSLNIENIGKYKTFDSLFTNEIVKAFNSVSWSAGSVNDTLVTMNITMLIKFAQSTMQTNSGNLTISVDSEARIKIDSIKISY